MNRAQIKLGPFEVFASTVGGVPLVAAGLLLFADSRTAPQVFGGIIDAPLTSALLLLLLCYIAGTALSNLSWRFFRRICSLLSLDYRYLRDVVLEDAANSEDQISVQIVPMISDKFGAPFNRNSLDARVRAYLVEHNRAEVLALAEMHQALHIMARNLSLGFVVLAVALAFNATQSSSWSYLTLVSVAASLAAASMTLLRAASFKLWHSRGLLLGFYFAETEMRLANPPDG